MIWGRFRSIPIYYVESVGEFFSTKNTAKSHFSRSARRMRSSGRGAGDEIFNVITKLEGQRNGLGFRRSVLIISHSLDFHIKQGFLSVADVE